jgi:hypothetical protein
MSEYVRMHAERDYGSDCVAVECTLGTDEVATDAWEILNVM